MTWQAHHSPPPPRARDDASDGDGSGGDGSRSPDDRYAVPSYGSAFSQTREVADSRTPLSVLIQGEDHERVASNRAIEAAVERIVERLQEELGEREDLALEEIVREAIEDEIQQTRLNTARGMLRYFWHGGLNPWEAMKKLLAATRLAAGHLIGGASQTEVAFILGETKAATSAREKKKVEELLRSWGVKGYHLDGGLKSDEARAVYREIRKGNKSRAKGGRRKRAEELRRKAEG